MVGRVRLVGVTSRFAFFLVFAFLDIAKNCLYFHVVSGLASSLFLTYEPQ